MSRKQRNIFAAFAQRRQPQPDHVQPVIQVLTKQAFADPCFQILIGRGDDADTRANRLMAADPVESPIRQHAQQARLQLGRHVADLIQEQSAVFGLFEATSPQSLCPREGAAVVTEELRFQKVFRHCGGIYCDERLVCRRTMAVQCSRHKFLACSRLAGDQDRGARLRQAADCAEHLLHRLSLSENVRRTGQRLLGFLLAHALAQCPPDELDRLVDVEWLWQVLERATLERRHGRLQIGVCGHDNDRKIGETLLQGLQQLQARGAGHADV